MARSLKLYTNPFSYNAARCELVLAEKGVTDDVEMIFADFFGSRSYRTPDFLSKSDFGQVPLLEDSDTGTAIYESRAIGRYLATKFADREPPLIPQPSAKLQELGAFEQALCVEAFKFDPYASPLMWLVVGAPMVGQPHEPEKIQYNSTRLGKSLDVIDRILSTQKYMAGDNFSLVDINYMPVVHVLHTTCDSTLVGSRPNLSRWWTEVTARRSWAKIVGPLDEAWQEAVRKGKERSAAKST